jgi:F-type H+-transporting ATPase subunit a
MHEHELWFTALLNRFVPGIANAALQLVGLHAEDPAKPWPNYMAMEILVALIVVIAAALLRSRLSVERPGTMQQTFEMIYQFLRDQAHEIIGHDYKKHVAWFGTLFIFILTANLIGIVPGFEAPTMAYVIPAGMAVATFLYYNVSGFRAQGFLGYLKHFAGPIWWLAWFMFPLELISHSIRPVSLTIRLYANMLAGEQVTLGFLALIPLLIPVIFMALHLFVSLLQAFIFTVLSMVYVGEAVAHEDA